MQYLEIAVAGAGFAGAVIARELAESGHCRVLVFDPRAHVAGNCHTERDAATGILVHRYGPHIFHTDREEVWRYVNRFATFGPYTNRVKAVTDRGIFSLPINLLTLNQYFGRRFNPREAQSFLQAQGDATILEPQSFEEQALRFLGRELYRSFFYGYTKKQWGREPRELPASILQRLPVRFNYDDNYYASRYQGIPLEGYTRLVEKILDHPAIELRLGQTFVRGWREDFDHVFFSGPLDAYFDYVLGELSYRTLDFERVEDEGDFQGNPVLNYCEEKVPFTRISEHKHFMPWESHARTVCFREYSREARRGDVVYYPVRLAADKALLEAYVARAWQESGVTFVGRLGTYRYLDMHAVIGESLDLSRQCLEAGFTPEAWPVFSYPPLPGLADLARGGRPGARGGGEARLPPGSHH